MLLAGMIVASSIPFTSRHGFAVVNKVVKLGVIEGVNVWLGLSDGTVDDSVVWEGVGDDETCVTEGVVPLGVGVNEGVKLLGVG